MSLALSPCSCDVESKDAKELTRTGRSFLWSHSEIDDSNVSSKPSFRQLAPTPPNIPFIASVSSICSVVSTGGSLMKEPTCLQRPMTKSRFRYLCGTISIVLCIEITILLSTLVISSCSFYTVSVVDDDGRPFVFDTGLFRYSIHSENFSEGLDCKSYNEIERQKLKNLVLLSWLEETASMVQTSQTWSIASPAVAALACVSTAVEVFKPEYYPGIWFTQILLFLAGLSQALVIAMFDEASACNMYGIVQKASINLCERSSGFGNAIASITLYIALSILVVSIPGRQATQGEPCAKKVLSCCRTMNDTPQNDRGERGKQIDRKRTSSKSVLLKEDSVTFRQCDQDDRNKYKRFKPECAKSDQTLFGIAMDGIEEDVVQSSDGSTKLTSFFSDPCNSHEHYTKSLTQMYTNWESENPAPIDIQQRNDDTSLVDSFLGLPPQTVEKNDNALQCSTPGWIGWIASFVEEIGPEDEVNWDKNKLAKTCTMPQGDTCL